MCTSCFLSALSLVVMIERVRCGTPCLGKSCSLSRATRMWSMPSHITILMGKQYRGTYMYIKFSTFIFYSNYTIYISFCRDKIATGSFDKTCKVRMHIICTAITQDIKHSMHSIVTDQSLIHNYYSLSLCSYGVARMESVTTHSVATRLR